MLGILLVAALMALIGIQAFAPAQASALQTNFCGLRPSGFICQGGVYHTYVFDEDYYAGSGTLEYSCEFMTRQSGEERNGAICNHWTNWVNNYYGLTGVGWMAKCFFLLGSTEHTYNCKANT